ncbi:MAG: hypothetical protein KDA42_03590 [Planctomycetales bacterium]|nr:hypothetical protein [Planctomycetales bacterium]
MNDRQTLWRKLRYVAAIVVLIIPLSMLSMPSSGSGTRNERSGGKLAQLRKEYKLSQTNLGEIDPASETMKLATLGMRGVAANVLWHRADTYKKKEDWTNLSATLEQITKIQPNFISVWQFQAWNLSYNVSVEFDDYNDRYYWVIRGINFLKDGIEYNEDDPVLLNDIGWFVGQKIGRADEHVQFRKLFKADDDYHNAEDPHRTQKQRDNWLVSRLWYQRAEDVVDSGRKSLRKKNPLLFYSSSSMALMNYADALIDDGVLGDEVKLAWQDADRAWTDYGDRPIMTSYGFHIHLNDLERKNQEAAEKRLRLEALAPEVTQAIHARLLAELDPPLREAWETPVDQRNEEQQHLATAAERTMKIPLAPLAKAIREASPQQGSEADRLARLASVAAEEARATQHYRDTVNFSYWKSRAEMEQTDDALLARKHIQEGNLALREASLIQALKLYEQGLDSWRKVVDRFPTLIDEGTTGDDLIEIIEKYAQIRSEAAIEEGDEKFPPEFPLRDIVERYDSEGKLRALLTLPGAAENPAEDAESPATDKPEPTPTDSPDSTPNETATPEAASETGDYEGRPPEPVDNAA